MHFHFHTSRRTSKQSHPKPIIEADDKGKIKKDVKELATKSQAGSHCNKGYMFSKYELVIINRY